MNMSAAESTTIQTVVPPLRAQGLILLVVTDPGARKDPEKRGPEEITLPPTPHSRREKADSQASLLPTNLLANQVAPRIPSNLPEETL